MTAALMQLRISIDRHASVFWLLLICAAAAGVRFYGLTFQSYGVAEALNAWYSNPVLSYADLIEFTRSDGGPPLHPLTMWWSYRLFGYTEFAGRLPSAVFGVLTIPAVFLLGRELFDSRTGLYAAAFAVPNYYLVYYAQEAHSYALLCLLASLSWLFFLRTLRRAGWLTLLLYVLTTIALMYTHYGLFVVLAIQGGVLLVCWLLWEPLHRRRLISVLVAMALIVLAAIPLGSGMTQQAGMTDDRIAQPPLVIAARYFAGYFDSPGLAACFAVLIASGFVAATAGARGEEERSGSTFAGLALMAWAVLGFLLPWAWGLVAAPVITAPSTIIVVPPLLLLAGFGLSTVPLLLLQRLVGAMLIAVSFYHLLFAADYYGTVTKNQYREITAALNDYPMRLPVYALKPNAARYNVYFEQSRSRLRALDYRLLEARRVAGTVEPLFWLVGSDGPYQDIEADKSSELVQVARYEFRGTAAELLLNPADAARVTLEQSVLSSGSGTNWLSTRPFVWDRGATQLLVALNRTARKDPLREVQVDLLDVQGHLLESHSATLGAIPSTLQISPQLEPGIQARLIVRMPGGEPEPEVWVLRTASVTP